MYKLVVFDCDGTLLNSRKEMSDSTLSSIKKLVANGIKVVIASARPFYRLRPYLERIGTMSDDQYTISFNGGLITNNTDTSTILTTGFKNNEINSIISYGESIHTHIFMYSKDAVFSNFNDLKYQKKNPDVAFKVVDLSEVISSNIEIFKIVYVNTPDITQEIRDNLPQAMIDEYEVSSSVPQFVEFVPKGITKAMALSIISERLNITSKDIIAFGDEDNDIPMLKYAGYSVAMGNASKKVQEMADYITKSNDDDGVAHALQLLFSDL